MAIRTAADKILAEVEFITAEKTGDYGPYCSVLFRRYDLEGDDAKLWRALPPDQARQFTKKQQVYLIPATRKGRQTWDIELIDNGATPPAPTQPVAESPGKYRIPDQQKTQIAEYAADMVKLLGYCRGLVQQELGDVDEETIRASTASIFISVTRKFNL